MPNPRRSRRSRKLSAKNIFNSNSAKAQAAQIYALKKRLNYLAKQNRPETKVYGGTVGSYDFSSNDITNTYKMLYFDGPAQGTADNNRIGNFVRSKSLQFCLTGEYYNTSDTGYHNSESAGSPIRIIILQRKRAENMAVSPSTILSITGGVGDAYTQQAIAPLATGITDRFTVLCDRKYMFTTNRNQLLKKITVKPKNIRWDDTTGTANGFVILIISAGLHVDNNFTEHIKGTYSLKYVYSDA